MHFNLYAIPVFVAALVLALLAIVLIRLRTTSGVRCIIAFMVAGFVYSFFYALELSSQTLDLAYSFYKFQYLGITFIPVAFLLFSIHYSGLKLRFDLLFKTVLFFFPLLTLLLIFTNPQHRLFVTNTGMSFSGRFPTFSFEPAAGYWLFQVFALISYLTSLVILVQMFLRSPPAFRRQIIIIIIGAGFPFLIYIFYLLRIFPWGIDPIPFSFMFMGIFTAIGLYRYNLFNLAPLARNLLFDKLPEFVLVFDNRNRLVDCNKKSSDILKIRSEDIGKPAVEALQQYPEIAAIMEKDTSDEYFETKLIITGVETFYRCSLSAIIDDKQNYRGRMLIMHDVTKQRIAELQQRESEEKFRLIVENAPLGVIYFDSNGVIRICNDQFVQIMGSSHEKLVGLDMMQLPDERVRNILITALSGQKAGFEGYYTSVTAGKTTPVRVIFDAISNENGDIIGGIGVIEDITERKRAEENIKRKNEELEHLNAEKDRFFSIIAHDLRSPFNAFLGFTEIMTDRSFNLTKEEMTEYAHEIRKSALLLFGLLENLLEWSRLQRNIISVRKQLFPLRGIIEMSLNALTENATKKEIKIEVEVDETLMIYADDKMMQSVFRNLISNAIKFTHHGGSVKIKAEERAGFTEIAVSDNGVGIEPDVIHELFRIDRVVSASGTDGEPSAGLGLILCKEFVEKHNGKIWVKSEPGKGSIFTFTLPKNL
jgi:PAS domain S-box-containing protein